MQNRMIIRGALLVAFATVAAIPALYGQSACDALVEDGAHVFDGDQAKVEAAANALVNMGVDVRVRTFESLGRASSLERLERSIEARCPSWTAPDGGRKNNLVVLMVAAKDRKTGLYYGSQWRRPLESQWTRIQADEMNPRFRDRDFAGGFASGLDEIRRVIDAATHTPIGGSSPVVVMPQAPQAPTDYSGLWKILGWLLGLTTFGALIWFILRVAGTRSREHEERAGAKQRAVIAQQGVSTLISKLNPNFPAFEAITADKKRVEKVKSLLDGASESFSRLKQSNVGDPDQDLSAAQYLAIAKEYEGLLDDLKEANFLIENTSGEYRPSQSTARSSDVPRPGNGQRQRHDPVRPSHQPMPTRTNVGSIDRRPAVDNSTTVFAPVIISEPERSEREVYNPPVIETPSRSSDDDGGSTSFGSSSSGDSDSGGGSSDWGSSSSDSGGSSSDFGSSDSGSGGGDSSF
jgi:uncharacterized membrane protein YgcG